MSASLIGCLGQALFPFVYLGSGTHPGHASLRSLVDAYAAPLHWLIRDGAHICWNLEDFRPFWQPCAGIGIVTIGEYNPIAWGVFVEFELQAPFSDDNRVR